MKNTILRILSLVLLLSVIGSVVLACTNTPDDPKESGSETDAPTESVPETEDLYDANGYLKDDIPADIDLKNEVVTIFHWNNPKNPEFNEEDDGTIINGALYERNVTVADRLNVQLNWVGEPGDFSQRNDFNQKIQGDLSGDCEYDIIAAYSQTIAMAATNGYAMDLIGLGDQIKLSKPWWGKDLNDMATINGKVYFATGDISTNYLLRMYGVFFNKSILADNNLEDPYALVESGKWTVDKFIELAQTLKVEDPNAGGIYGLVHDALTVEALFYGANLCFVDKDATDMPKLSDSWNGEKANALTDKFGNFCKTNSALNTKDDKKLFAGSSSLFIINSLDLAMNQLADAGVEFGIVPIPKYDEAQDNYATTLNYKYTLYMISTGTDIREVASYTLEALASQGYRTVTPDLYEKAMKLRYTTDETSQKMIDYIRDGVSFEIGRTFTHIFDNKTYQDIRKALAGTATKNWQTTAAGLEPAFEIQMGKLLAAFGINK